MFPLMISKCCVHGCAEETDSYSSATRSFCGKHWHESMPEKGNLIIISDETAFWQKVKITISIWKGK